MKGPNRFSPAISFLILSLCLLAAFALTGCGKSSGSGKYATTKTYKVQINRALNSWVVSAAPANLNAIAAGTTVTIDFAAGINLNRVVAQSMNSDASNPPLTRKDSTISFTMPRCNVQIIGIGIPEAPDTDPTKKAYMLSIVTDKTGGALEVYATPPDGSQPFYVESGNEAPEKTAVTINASASDGYQLKSLTVAYASGGNTYHLINWPQDAAAQHPFKFTMPAADVTITAQWLELAQSRTLSLQTEAQGGSVSAAWVMDDQSGSLDAGATSMLVPSGASVTLTITPESNHIVKRLAIYHDNTNPTRYIFNYPDDDRTLTVPLRFTMPDAHVTVKTTWAEARTLALDTQKPGGTVRATWSQSGRRQTLTDSGSVAIPTGTEISLTLTPDAGYLVESFKVKRHEPDTAATLYDYPSDGRTDITRPINVTMVDNTHITVTTKWKSRPGLAFDLNGGTGSVPDRKFYAIGTVIDLSRGIVGEEIPAPAANFSPPDGNPELQFLGWTTLPDHPAEGDSENLAGDGIYNVGDIDPGSAAATGNWYMANAGASSGDKRRQIKITGAVTLYAIWGFNLRTGTDDPNTAQLADGDWSRISLSSGGGAASLSGANSPFLETAFYRLTNDLSDPRDPINGADAGGIVSKPYDSASQAFRGTLDGNGHTIELDIKDYVHITDPNICTHQEAGVDDCYFGGLFPVTKGAAIRNLALKGTLDIAATHNFQNPSGSRISLQYFAGALAGMSMVETSVRGAGRSGGFRNIASSANVVISNTSNDTGSSGVKDFVLNYFGGLAGLLHTPITNCSVNASAINVTTKVTGSNLTINMGGVIGASILPDIVSNCYVSSPVTLKDEGSNYTYFGGITGGSDLAGNKDPIPGNVVHSVGLSPYLKYRPTHHSIDRVSGTNQNDIGITFQENYAREDMVLEEGRTPEICQQDYCSGKSAEEYDLGSSAGRGVPLADLLGQSGGNYHGAGWWQTSRLASSWNVANSCQTQDACTSENPWVWYWHEDKYDPSQSWGLPKLWFAPTPAKPEPAPKPLP